MAYSRFPELPARYRFMCRDQSVERALRQGQRHVRQGRGIRDRAHELGAPCLTRAATVPDLQALEVAVGIQRLVRAVPVEESEIEPWTDHVRTDLRFELP